MPTDRTAQLPRTPGALRSRRVAATLACATLGLGAGAVAIPQGAGAVPPGGAVNKSNGASVSISTTSVKAGGRIKVTGRNWKSKGSRTQKGAKVTVKIDDGIILAVFPIKNKSFSGYVTIPKQIKAGNHWLRFLAAKPATSIKSKTFKVKK